MARLYEKEQEHIQREKARIRGEEEFRAEQEKMATLAMLPTEQAERLRAAQSISFMYPKPPGYDAMVEREVRVLHAAQRWLSNAFVMYRQGVGGVVLPLGLTRLFCSSLLFESPFCRKRKLRPSDRRKRRAVLWVTPPQIGGTRQARAA